MKPHPALLPLSWIYGAGVGLRNMFFDIGMLKIRTVSAPVISVGNISTGGTGKTPFVELLVSELKRRGKRTGILSRGYGRESRGYQVVSNGRQRCAEAISAGDEPALLANRVNDVPIAVDEERVRGARKMLDAFGVDVILLDDGFQHRSLGRSCDFVLMTADELREDSRLLPAGYRREPWSSLERASMIVISKCADRETFESAKARLPRHAPPLVAGIRTTVSQIRRFQSGEAVRPSSMQGKAVAAFSGIGDPGGFEATLSGLGSRVMGHLRFPDHHWFTKRDLDRIEELLIRTGAEMIVSTEKDAVRLDRLEEGEREVLNRIPIYIVEIRAEMLTGAEALAAALDAAFEEGKEGRR